MLFQYWTNMISCIFESQCNKKVYNIVYASYDHCLNNWLSLDCRKLLKWPTAWFKLLWTCGLLLAKCWRYKFIATLVHRHFPSTVHAPFGCSARLSWRSWDPSGSKLLWVSVIVTSASSIRYYSFLCTVAFTLQGFIACCFTLA